jgi:hypothetical protein
MGYRTRNTCRANVLGTSTKPAYWSWISPRRGGQDPLPTTGSTRMPPALEGKEPTLFCDRVGSPASTRSLSKRGPHSQAHLTMTSVASVYPDSCVASFRKDLDGRNVHFFAALAGRAFSAAGHQGARTETLITRELELSRGTMPRTADSSISSIRRAKAAGKRRWVIAERKVARKRPDRPFGEMALGGGGIVARRFAIVPRE